MGQVASRNVRGFCVLDLSGAFKSGADAAMIESEIAQELTAGPDGIIVNFGAVTEMTSGNYGVFLKTVATASKLAKESSVPVKILIPDGAEVQRYIDHLKITKLDTLVEVHATETAALNSLGHA